METSKAILTLLPEIIKKKEASFKFSNVGDLMYHFVQGGMTQNKNFIYYLEKVADD